MGLCPLRSEALPGMKIASLRAEQRHKPRPYRSQARNETQNIMNMQSSLIRITPPAVKSIVRRTCAFLLPGVFKGHFELQYWKSRCGVGNGPLYNAHYESLYTEVFDLQRKDYEGKRVLDIGCGPRGSLEWADMTAQRVGLDPLVPGYLKLGADKHKMEYVASGSENIPFPSGHFDIVACLNALDHVDDLEATIREIKRVAKPGGLFLLSVETDHPPNTDGTHNHQRGYASRAWPGISTGTRVQGWNA